MAYDEIRDLSLLASLYGQAGAPPASESFAYGPEAADGNLPDDEARQTGLDERLARLVRMFDR